MSDVSHVESSTGPSLEEIVSHSGLWAARIEIVAQSNNVLGLLTELLEELKQVPGPVARARETQVKLGMDKPFYEVVSGIKDHLDHPLCKAMYLTAILDQHMEEAYTYVMEQPEHMSHDRTDIVAQEAQMRWDFVRAQAFGIAGDNEALRLYDMARRTATDLDFDCIFHLSNIQICFLSTDLSVPDMLCEMQAIMDEAMKTRDVRAIDPGLYYLCALYVQTEDFHSFVYYANMISNEEIRRQMVMFGEMAIGQSENEFSAIPNRREDPFFFTSDLMWSYAILRKYAQLERKEREAAEAAEIAAAKEKEENWAERIMERSSPEHPAEMPLVSFLGEVVKASTLTEIGHYEDAQKIIKKMYKAIQCKDNRSVIEKYVDVAHLKYVRKSGFERTLKDRLEERVSTSLEAHALVRNLVGHMDPEWFCGLRMLN